MTGTLADDETPVARAIGEVVGAAHPSCRGPLPPRVRRTPRPTVSTRATDVRRCRPRAGSPSSNPAPRVVSRSRRSSPRAERSGSESPPASVHGQPSHTPVPTPETGRRLGPGRTDGVHGAVGVGAARRPPDETRGNPPCGYAPSRRTPHRSSPSASPAASRAGFPPGGRGQTFPHPGRRSANSP
jgi:hypothetical protein